MKTADEMLQMENKSVDLDITLEKAMELLKENKKIEKALALEGIATCSVETKTCKLQIKIVQF